MGEIVASERALIAESVVRKYVSFAVAAGVVPLPLVDLAVITGIQVRMIQQIAKVYDKSFSEKPVRATIVSLVGGTASVGLGAAAASLIKIVPFVGSALGGLGVPMLAGASTYAVGEVYLQHFEKGGEVGDLKVESVRGAYREHFAQGKEVAQETAPQAEGPVVEQPAV